MKKTAIVYLDIDDEITSAVARLRSLKEDRIALILPHGSRLATSRINFRLLAREAANRRKTLEIVTGDASARALAASAGLPTHVSVAAFEAGPQASGAAVGGMVASGGTVGAVTDQSRRGGSSPDEGPGQDEVRDRPAGGPGPGMDDSPTVAMSTATRLASPRAATPVPQVGRRLASPTRGRRLALVLGLVAVFVAGAVAGFQLLPSATIVLVPSVDTVGPIALNVTAQPGITQPDPVGLLVPATTFSFDVQVAQTFPATAVKVDETVATGKVTFENCDTGGSVQIPKGARVATTGGIQFVTEARVTVKRAHLFPFACEVGSVDVHAVLPGDAANLGPGRISVIPPGYDKVVLRVTNEAATSGGTHVETLTIQQSDIDSALGVLDAALAGTFAEQVAAATDVPPGTTLFPETRALGPTTPTVDPATLLGLAQATFDLGLTAQGTAIGVDASPVSTLAEARIRAAVDAGFSLDEGSIVPNVGVPIVVGTTITFPVSIRATETRLVDATALRDQIRGLGLPQARTVLGAFGQVTITVWPDWVTTIPSSDSRVVMRIDEPVRVSPDPGATQGPAVTPSGPPASGATP